MRAFIFSSIGHRGLALAVCLGGAALASCGGNTASLPASHPTPPASTPTSGASATAAPTATPAGTPTATPTASSTTAAIGQAFSITIPAAPATAGRAARGKPFYVSANTASIRIAVQSVNGTPSSIPATVAVTTTGAPGCTATAGGLTCIVTAAAGVGADVFAIATYASANAGGSPLATTTIAANVTSVAAAPIVLSLGGVPAAVAFSPSHLPLVNDGAIHRYAVTLDAVDASGATIVGSSAYAAGISLGITNDPTHALTLSTAAVSAPGEVVTITFDGSRSLAGAAIVATAAGASVARLDAAPLTFSPRALFAYDDQTSGVALSVSEAGFTGAFAAALATATDGGVAVSAGPLGSDSATVSVLPRTTFDVSSLSVTNGTYAGTVPVTIVPRPGPYTASGAAHTLGEPSGFVLAPNGVLWTADKAGGSVVSFDPANQTYAKYVVDPSGAGPTSVAFDSSGTLWFADGAQIGSINTSTHAIQTYTAGLYPDSDVLSIATGPAGSMWFYDERTNNVPYNVGSPTAFGTIATASGAITEFPTPNNATPALPYESMVLGPDNALWFADGMAGAIGRVTATGVYSDFSAAGPTSPNFHTDVVSNSPDGSIWFAGTNQGLGQGFIGNVDLATHTVALYQQGVESGEFDALIVGSDRNLWFAERPGVGDFFSNQDAIGVINVTTHATYAYAAIVPQDAVIAGLIDPGNRTLYMLDNAFGTIGKVPFK